MSSGIPPLPAEGRLSLSLPWPQPRTAAAASTQVAVLMALFSTHA
jgi:hypothetical protein